MNTMHDLQHQVQQVLMDDEDLQDYGIEVLDSNGVVTLRGTVRSVDDRERAEALVRNVAGVISVINEIDVV
ncbi:MAG TPA: BON domain-containing protein [Anaerolineales bacterium]|nr:BON domain-containing protein [Anaerolineales bacterium]